MKNYFRSFLIALCLLPMLVSVSAAQDAPLHAENAAIEKRVQKLSHELRCLVCQNQNLADSHADLALDLKQEIREMAGKGMNDQAIIDYLVARYGDFILYRPPFKLTTLLLWLGPFMLLVIGSVILWMTLKRRAQTADEQLSADEIRRVNELLNAHKDS